jgi:hypothetical protein
LYPPPTLSHFIPPAAQSIYLRGIDVKKNINFSGVTWWVSFLSYPDFYIDNEGKNQ